MKKRMFLLLGICFILALIVWSKKREWSYEERTGPEYWGELAPSNATCAKGSEQSPINIETSQVIEDENIIGKQINYEPTTFTLLNNGHTIQANATTENNSIVVEGIEYQLSQFHLHTPSEHQFNGQNYDVEIHFVHKDKSGKLAVLGVMIQEGRKNKVLATLWDSLPKEETKKAVSEKYLIHLPALLPKNQESFYYDGSLTTPPCTEDVQWIVFENPIQMSKEQIKAFQEIFEHNHRPVQPLNERDIIKN
ncbi:MAG: carbonic anhydrase family protein [Lysinibacillus sp.]